MPTRLPRCCSRGEEGNGAGPGTAGDFDYVLPSGDAAVRRRGPWFLVVSGLTAPVSDSRWIQDRQNFVSVYHDKAGLILGGGNTKLQPRWSNFTIGDVDLLRHKPGDENPKFLPPPGLVHVPTSARVLRGGDLGVELDYGGRRGRIVLKILGPDRLDYIWSGEAGMTAHITLLPHIGQVLKTAAGNAAELGDTPLRLTPGAWIELPSVRFQLPGGVTLAWPVLPHNPYRKDGRAEPSEARLVLDSPATGTLKMTLEVSNWR